MLLSLSNLGIRERGKGMEVLEICVAADGTHHFGDQIPLLHNSLYSDRVVAWAKDGGESQKCLCAFCHCINVHHHLWDFYI